MSLLKTTILAGALALATSAGAATAPRLQQATGTVQSIQSSAADGSGTLQLNTGTGTLNLKIPPGFTTVLGADGSRLHLDAIRRGDKVRADIANAPVNGRSEQVVTGLRDLSSPAVPGNFFPYGK